eukprot:753859_1
MYFDGISAWRTKEQIQSNGTRMDDQFKYKPPNDVIKSAYSGILHDVSDVFAKMYGEQRLEFRNIIDTMMKSKCKELDRADDVDYRINSIDYTIFEKPYVKMMKDLAIDCNGLLVHVKDGIKRIIVPTSLRTDLAFYYHKSSTNGHRGAQVVYDVLRERMWWSGMRKDVSIIVACYWTWIQRHEWTCFFWVFF